MDFGTIKTRIAQETGLDTTDDDTIMGAWVNAAYKHVCGIFNWPWLVKQATIQTVADITTGTVSINAGSTSLTFSSAPTISVATQFMIQIPTISSDWYIIANHSANSTSATLANPLVGSTNASGAAYIVRKVLYSLPADLDRIIDIRQATTKMKLGAIDVRTLDRYLPDPTAVADPLYYYLFGLDSSSKWQVGLYPTPQNVLNLQIRYMQQPTALSSSGDTPLIPDKFTDILVYGALYLFGYAYIDDTRVTLAKARFDDLLMEMKRNFSPIPDQMTVVQPWDTRPRRVVGRLNFPPNFPEYFR